MSMAFSATLLLSACLASYAGFACLALAMHEHWERMGWRRDGSAAPRWLRPAGPCLLLLAYGLCVWRDGASFGSLLWIVLISAASIAVAFTITWRTAGR
ncbi:DUF3325 domain-containing protein [Massilia timonae]|uniref:DUF3325 domain-containing protein n=1 Tax=Massilia timonae TaxID=47229 RepID=A0A1S2NEK1_9BURK|nr:DUF3325 domain-containing protein [Massilia timonae]OIJ43273.1 hypothetical protein LO55_4906 [Massilia timonae]